MLHLLAPATANCDIEHSMYKQVCLSIINTREENGT